MTARLSIKHVTVDCLQPQRLAQWWATLLDWDIEHDSSDYVVIADRLQTGTALGFVRVPERKTGKNRLHLDLAVTGAWVDAASHARRLGAVEIARQREYGQEWIVFADPEGNEFCI